ncbi:hypothetical protein [Candidatus Villigracilis saccharophilus]|uniref:hypothetical protein n=1 Tax=Candidatus Villigracilis saccharophilus TaxID=3140684 RepID=UPI00313649AB|nr:hypothetical protein [Anaerolineales bacterium]
MLSLASIDEFLQIALTFHALLTLLFVASQQIFCSELTGRLCGFFSSFPFQLFSDLPVSPYTCDLVSAQLSPQDYEVSASGRHLIALARFIAL